MELVVLYSNRIWQVRDPNIHKICSVDEFNITYIIPLSFELIDTDDVNSSFAQQQYADLSSSPSLSLPASVAAAAILQPKNTSNTSEYFVYSYLGFFILISIFFRSIRFCSIRICIICMHGNRFGKCIHVECDACWESS